MKRFISIFLVLIMLIGVLSSCSLFGKKEENESDSNTGGQSESNSESESQSNSDSESESESESESDTESGDDQTQTGTKYLLNSNADFVKLLDPRMEKKAEYITCDWSASGIEFVATFGGDLAFDVKADTKMGGGTFGCYFRVYIDGEECLNEGSPYYKAEGNTTITVKDIPEGTHTVKLVKATGYTLANVELKSITIDGTVSDTAPADKELFIEYVGDSICCGWGIIGDRNGAYNSQDAALAYPYLVSETLGADMSVIAVSSNGLIKGGTKSIANSYKYASINRSTSAEHSFSRKADVVVINADTNDAYQNTSTDAYIEALENFVAYVREKNPNAHIILVCNMMKANFNDVIGAYVKELGGAENKYYYYKAKMADPATAASSHPCKEEHVVYANELSVMIKSILDGTYVEPELDFDPPEKPTTTIPENYKPVYEQSFDSATNAADAGIVYMGGDLGATVVDGKLVIPYVGWDDCRALLVPNSAFSDSASKYLVEMDVTIGEKIGIFGVLLNTSGGSNSWNASKLNSHLITLRRDDGAKDDLLADKDLKFLAGYFDGSGNQQTPYSKFAYDVTEDGNASFKLSILVNNNRIDLFVDGEWIYGYEVPSDVDCSLKENSSIILWAQETNATIDNLTVKIDESTKGSVEIIPDPEIPSDYTTVYDQNYDTAGPAETGLINLYGGNLGATIVDGKLVIPEADWANCRAVLVPNSAFNDFASRYLLEMDVTIGAKLGVFGLLLNTTGASSNWNSDKVNSHLITLRRGDGTNGELLASKDIKFSAGYHNASGGQNTPYSQSAFDVTEDGNASFKLSILVNGNRVDLFIDGVWILGYDVPTDVDCSLKRDSAVILWAQSTNATIDNITVKIDESTKTERPADPPAPITTVPTDTTVIYSQNFDSAASAEDADVTGLYGSTVAPTIVDGKLSVPKTSWTKPPFLSLVDRTVFADCPESYMIEMDVNISELGVFGIIFNGATPEASDTEYKRANALLVTLRLGTGVDKLTSGTVGAKSGTCDVYLRTGYFGADKGQVTDTQNDKLVLDLKEGDTSADVKLTVVVSNGEGGCTVNVFANGVYIYSFTQDASFNVNENSYVSLWAQDAVFTIDNLVVSKF